VLKAYSIRPVISAIGPPTRALAEATRQAAERAVALAPTRPEGHRALGAFYANVLQDNGRAFREDSIALGYSPGTAELLALVGHDEEELGRLAAARAHLEQAVRLDPQSVWATGNLGRVLALTRDFAKAERVFDHAFQLQPNLISLDWVVTTHLSQGALARAQATIKNAMKVMDPSALVALHFDLYWVLDDAQQQQQLLRLTPVSFNNNRNGAVRGARCRVL
jgi:tetratricopeptide (TPR) repeat protein